MSRIIYPFEIYYFAFEFYHDDKIFICCYDSNKIIFETYDNRIKIYNFSDTMRFFKLLQSLEHFSKATVMNYQDSITYNFKTFNELTDYAITDKMKEFINATKIEEQTDTYDQKIYEFIEHLFSDHNSVQLVFVD